MDWIKKNYDKFVLGLLALLLIGISVVLFLNSQKFADNFSEAAASPNKSRKIPELDTSVIGAARQSLKSPNLWTSTNHSSLLFTSELYYLKDGLLKKPTDDSLYTHSRMAAPAGLIPNIWFLQNRLGLGAGVQFQDPDGDGFPNEDEWLYKTDPNAEASHPEYHTLLFLNRWIKVRFRLMFQAYDGDPKMPERMEFQINPLDAGATTKFAKIGEVIEGTKFKVLKFEFKEGKNPSTEEMEDVSELTVFNAETEETVTLVLHKEANSPNQFGEFDYRWKTNTLEKGQVFTVQKLKEFVLKPLIDQKYKLVDGNEAEALIDTPKGEKNVSVKPYPKK
jgi:hypothetical protein